MKWLLDYCKEHPVLVYVAAGLLAAIVLTVFCMTIVNAKGKSVNHTAETEEKSIAPLPSVEEEIAPSPAPAPAPTPGSVEKTDTVAETPAATQKPTQKKVETEKVSVVSVTPIKATEKPASKKEKTIKTKLTPPTAKPEKAPLAAKEIKPVIPPAPYEEDAIEETVKYRGKWAICRVVTEDENHEEMYFFELRASNGELLLSSEEYSSYNGLLRGIQTHKTNIAKDNFRISLSKKGFYIFKLLNGKNTLLCMGANYPTRTRCESAIESVKRFAETAVIDENVQDQVVKIPNEDNAPVPELAEGVEGKWIIQSAGEKDDKVFYFELYANNGEKLLSSEEYTTYVGAVNGIHTHKKNIENGNFRITLTKRGDYIYKLLNGNGQLLCLGEHYKTKRLCENAVDSVKRFSKGSPLLTEQTHIK